MKYIRIVVSKRDIFEEVARFTAYTGAKNSGDGEYFDRVATIEEDSPLLTRYWRDACAGITERLRDFITDSDAGGDTLFLELEVSSGYDESQNVFVEDLLFSSLSAGVTARWMRLASPEKAPQWEEEAAQNMEKMVKKLCHRKAPSRKISG